MHGTLDLEAMGSICAVELVPLREEAVGTILVNYKSNFLCS